MKVEVWTDAYGAVLLVEPRPGVDGVRDRAKRLDHGLTLKGTASLNLTTDLLATDDENLAPDED